MRALPRTGAMAALAVAALAGVVLVVGRPGGGEPTEPFGTVGLSSVSPPTDPSLDYTDPTAVCLRFADAVHRRDAGTDSGPQAAYRRAMAYATGELAAAVAAEPERHDQHWSTLLAHRAATNPTVTSAVAVGDVQPADTATESYRAAQVAVTPVGVDGWRGPAEHWLVLCTLRRDTGGWRVERYQISEAPGPP